VGDVADEGATAGRSADTGLSGCGIINIAINVRANPVGSAIQPAHPAAGMMRRRMCRSRDLGRGNHGGDGASPCHSHRPDSLLSVLIKTASDEFDVGASSVTATAWPIDPRCSACMAHKSPLSCTPTSRVQSVGTLDGSAPHRFSKRPRLVVARLHRRAKPSSFRSEGTTRSPICGRVAPEARFGCGDQT